jgi:hypothetical protein
VRFSVPALKWLAETTLAKSGSRQNEVRYSRFAAFIGNNAFAAFVGEGAFSRPDASSQT